LAIRLVSRRDAAEKHLGTTKFPALAGLHRNNSVAKVLRGGVRKFAEMNPRLSAER
jgi:hypothetical protein